MNADVKEKFDSWKADVITKLREEVVVMSRIIERNQKMIKELETTSTQPKVNVIK